MSVCAFFSQNANNSIRATMKSRYPGDRHSGQPFLPRGALSTGLDHTRESVESFHEAQRARCAPAAREDRVFLPQRGQVGSCTGAPLEQHSFGLRRIRESIEQVLHRNDKAGRTLRRVRCRDAAFSSCGRLIPIPAVAACSFIPTLNHTGELNRLSVSAPGAPARSGNSQRPRSPEIPPFSSPSP